MKMTNSSKFQSVSTSAIALLFLSSASSLSIPKESTVQVAKPRIPSVLGTAINAEYVSFLFQAAARHEFNQEGDTVKFTDTNGNEWVTSYAGIILFKMRSSQYVKSAPAADGTLGSDVPITMTCLAWKTPRPVGATITNSDKSNSACLSGINIPTAPDTHWQSIDQADWQVLLASQETLGWNVFLGRSIQGAEVSDVGKASERICHRLVYSPVADTSPAMPPANAPMNVRDADGQTINVPVAPLCFQTHVPTYAIHPAG